MNDSKDLNLARPVAKFVLRAPPAVKENREIRTAKQGAPLDLLVDAGGAPVWPSRDAQDTDALLSISRVFGGSVVHATEPRPSPELAVRSGEAVLGIGDVEEETRLYAHLTGRSYGVASAVPSASLPADVAVVICLGGLIDPALIELFSLIDYGKRAPGIVWGRTRGELRRRILVSSSAAALSTPMATPPINIVGPRMGWLAPTPNDFHRLKQDLGSGSGVLTIYGHSDGIAQELPGGAALCARADPGMEGDPMRAPECVYTGQCNRLEMPVESARAANLLVSPAEIAGRIVANIACQAAFVGNRALDSAWSTFPVFQANPSIGALIAPAHVFRLTGALGDELVARLKDGSSVGEALARYDESPLRETVHERLLLFGDPRVRATSRVAPPQLVRVPMVAPGRQSKDRGEDRAETGSSPELDMIRLMARLNRPETLVKCRENSQRILDLLVALGDQDVETKVGVRRKLQEAVLRQLALNRGRLSDAWQSDAVSSKEGQVVGCPNCGIRAPVVHVKLRTGMAREVFTCFACADVFDYQVGNPLRPRLEPPFVSLEGPLGGEDWAGTVILVRKKLSDTTTVQWPKDREGTPSKGFRIDAELEPGPVWIYAVFMNSLAMSSMSAVVAGVDSDDVRAG
jgi:hypothetical protein